MNKQTLNKLNKQASEEILAVLGKHDVPLQHSVALLCKMRGVTLTEVAKACGCHRNLLYKALAGEIAPNNELVTGVAAFLGMNPWKLKRGKTHEIASEKLIAQVNNN